MDLIYYAMIDTETLNKLKDLRSQGFPDEMYDIIDEIYEKARDGKMESCRTNAEYIESSVFCFTGEIPRDYPKGNSLFDALNGVHRLLVPDFDYNDACISYTEYSEIERIHSALQGLGVEKITERFNSSDLADFADESGLGTLDESDLETLIKDYFMFLEFYQNTKKAGKNVLVIFP
jgi:hypothetical protein